MPIFNELPIANGDGPVHINYFRVYIKPRPGETLPDGAKLLKLMPHFMDPHTASVRDSSQLWRGMKTLKFKGVGRVRPFAVIFTGVATPPLVIPLPDELAGVGVPESIRTLMVPQLHRDFVGLVAAPYPHSFTAMTLKRNYQNGEDNIIRSMIQRYVEDQPLRNWVDAVFILGRAAVDPTGPLRDRAIAALSKRLADFAVSVNQHHFLAGRRSFRMGTVGGLELSEPGVGDKEWVFETAAVERYALATFAHATNLGMGGAARVVRPVWTEMCQRVASTFGKTIGHVEIKQGEYSGIASAAGSRLYKDIKRRHVALFPGF